MSAHSASAPTVHHFTRAEYAHMATTGLFDDERVELLDGEIITMSPKLSSHTSKPDVKPQ